MREDSILLLGCGGHARSCIDLIEQQGRFRIAGLVGATDQVGSKMLGYPVLGDDASLPQLLLRFRHALVTVGQIKSPDTRIRLFELARQFGCEMPVVISPQAYISRHAHVGDGTVVIQGAVINACAEIGKNCIVNTAAVIDHDASVADHCHVSTMAVLNGGVRVGTGTFIGSNVLVRQDIRIGARCVIGLGQRVISDCADETRVPLSGGHS